MDNTQELIKRLKAYNEWRRGAETEQPSPDQLGKDLDSAIAILAEYEEMALENRKLKSKIKWIHGFVSSNLVMW